MQYCVHFPSRSYPPFRLSRKRKEQFVVLKKEPPGGDEAAGPVGAIVGGAVGAVTGTVGGILGVEPRRREREIEVVPAEPRRERDIEIRERERPDTRR